MELTAEDKYKLQKIEEFSTYEWFVEVGKLDEGKSFGELALLNNAPRAASIECLTDCYFALLGKAEYGKVVRRIDKKLEEQKIEFFSRLPFCYNKTTR